MEQCVNNIHTCIKIHFTKDYIYAQAVNVGSDTMRTSKTDIQSTEMETIDEQQQPNVCWFVCVCGLNGNLFLEK